MNNTEKTYQSMQGPWAWLADIEIGKTAYLLAYGLLVLGMVLVRQPMLEFSAYGESISFALHELDGMNWAYISVFVMNIVSIFALMIPMIKFFEWKYTWFLPTAITSVAELGGMIYILNKVDEILEDSLIGYVYQLLSIEVELTTTGWMFITYCVLTLVCAMKMLLDIRNNIMKYQY